MLHTRLKTALSEPVELMLSGDGYINMRAALRTLLVFTYLIHPIRTNRSIPNPE